MKAKLLCIVLLLSSSAMNAAGIQILDLGKVYEQADRAEAARQEREYREIQLQQQRQQQEQQLRQEQQRAEQERRQFQEQQAQQQQQQLRQQQSRPTGKACMKDCKEAGYKYNECRDECMPKTNGEK